MSHWYARSFVARRHGLGVGTRLGLRGRPGLSLRSWLRRGAVESTPGCREESRFRQEEQPSVRLARSRKLGIILAAQHVVEEAG
jgi:hypothetical protein